MELSVVVPVRNCAQWIDEQLDALRAQETAWPWEILVVDNGSTDGTLERVARHAAHDERVRLLDGSERRGPSHARNVGIEAAHAEAIALCDADDVVAPGWAAAMGAALRRHPLVAGRLDVDTLNPAWLVDTRGRAIEQGAGNFLGLFEFAHSCNMGVRRSLVRDRGGFDEDLLTGEDIELSFRMWQAGIRLVYVEGAVVRSRYRTTMPGLWQQARAHARATPVLARRFRAAGLDLPAGGELRRWAWLARHAASVTTRAGRARWLWVAGSRVGRIEGTWHAHRRSVAAAPWT